MTVVNQHTPEIVRAIVMEKGPPLTDTKQRRRIEVLLRFPSSDVNTIGLGSRVIGWGMAINTTQACKQTLAGIYQGLVYPPPCRVA